MFQDLKQIQNADNYCSSKSFIQSIFMNSLIKKDFKRMIHLSYFYFTVKPGLSSNCTVQRRKLFFFSEFFQYDLSFRKLQLCFLIKYQFLYNCNCFFYFKLSLFHCVFLISAKFRDLVSFFFLRKKQIINGHPQLVHAFF